MLNRIYRILRIPSRLASVEAESVGTIIRVLELEGRIRNLEIELDYLRGLDLGRAVAGKGKHETETDG